MDNFINWEKEFVFKASNGAVTEPRNGSYLCALAVFFGYEEPWNGSWIQTICFHYGIVEPINVSWYQALAEHFGFQEPINNSWKYSLAFIDVEPPGPEYLEPEVVFTKGVSFNSATSNATYTFSEFEVQPGDIIIGLHSKGLTSTFFTEITDPEYTFIAPIPNNDRSYFSLVYKICDGSETSYTLTSSDAREVGRIYIIRNADKLTFLANGTSISGSTDPPAISPDWGPSDIPTLYIAGFTQTRSNWTTEYPDNYTNELLITNAFSSLSGRTSIASAQKLSATTETEDPTPFIPTSLQSGQMAITIGLGGKEI